MKEMERLFPADGEITDEAAGQAMADTGAFYSVRIEKRDDRFLVFGNTEAGKSEFVYQLRAVTRGTFAIPPLHAESMYQPDVNGETAESGKLIVK